MTARLHLPSVAPAVFRAMVELDRSAGEAGLARELVLLVQTRVSQLNGCGYCIDMHIKDGVRAGESVQRYYGLDAWREAPYYTDAERAALELAEAMTRIDGGVSDGVWERAAAAFDDRALAGLVGVIVSINGWNRLAVATRHPAPGSYEPAG